MIKSLDDILKHPKINELASYYGHPSIMTDYKERRIDNPQNLRVTDILVMSKVLGIDAQKLFELAADKLKDKDPLSLIPNKPWSGRKTDLGAVKKVKELSAQNISVTVIAEQLKLSRVTVYKYLNVKL